MPIWRQLRLREPFEPLVLVGGAMVSEPDTGRTLCQKTMPREAAFDFADALVEAGYSAMTLVDAWRWGVDYYFAEAGDAERVRATWFGRMKAEVRAVRRLRDVAGMPRPLRIAAVADRQAAARLAGELAGRFAGRLNVHSILAPNYGVTIVEAFDSAVSKFSALRYVGQAQRIAPGRIVAVGDDINDLEMVSGAGLGVAMAGGAARLCAVADHVARSGLARFIQDLLAGRFDAKTKSG